MTRLTSLTPQFVEVMPDEFEHGTLYVSEKYGVAIHLCACGCGQKVVTPLDTPLGWKYTREGDAVTLSPSIGNWQIPCRTHYFIRENQVVWC